MVADAEAVCAELGLTYRINQLCTGDLGFAAQITGFNSGASIETITDGSWQW